VVLGDGALWISNLADEHVPDAIIALCCCVLSGRFEDIWERRSALAGAERWPRSHEDVVRPALVIQGMCVQGV
jgi:hypothetical protein